MQKSFMQVCWFLGTVPLKSHFRGVIGDSWKKTVGSQADPFKVSEKYNQSGQIACQYFYFILKYYNILCCTCCVIFKQANIKQYMRWSHSALVDYLTSYLRVPLTIQPEVLILRRNYILPKVFAWSFHSCFQCQPNTPAGIGK